MIVCAECSWRKWHEASTNDAISQAGRRIGLHDSQQFRKWRPDSPMVSGPANEKMAKYGR